MSDENEQDEQVIRHTSDDGDPQKPDIATPPDPAAYRWLLRRLFAGDTTPPPPEDSKRDLERRNQD